MLLEFGFNNYFSFKEGARVSFRLGNNVPDNVSRGRDHSTAICIKGANASGKTNVLRAASFICNFAIKSFASEPDRELQFSPHFDNAHPSEFFIEFRIRETTYLYTLIATEKEVHEEKLYRTVKKRAQIISRTRGRITCNKEFARLKTMKLRKNASFISHARQHGYDELKDVIDFFESIVSNVAYGGLVPDAVPDETTSQWLHDGPKGLLEFLSEFISDCDTGIRSIKIFENKNKLDTAAKYFPIFFHGENETLPVTMHTESSGTKALFRRLAIYKCILETGGVAIFDEIDIHLHPHVLKKLLSLFLEPENNPKAAQLLFTTHNLEVMDTLGRYRTYLVQKEQNESFMYRLDEIPGDVLRNDRPISPIYNDGKIGGVPKI